MGLCSSRVAGSPSLSMCPAVARSFVKPTEVQEYDGNVTPHMYEQRRNGPQVDGDVA